MIFFFISYRIVINLEEDRKLSDFFVVWGWFPSAYIQNSYFDWIFFDVLKLNIVKSHFREEENMIAFVCCSLYAITSQSQQVYTDQHSVIPNGWIDL